MGLGTQPKGEHSDYTTLIGQANRQEAGADMGIGLGTNSTSHRGTLSLSSRHGSQGAKQGCVSLFTCAQGTGGVLPESPSGSGPAAFWCSEPIECSRHGRMQTTFSSVTIQGLCNLIDNAPLSSHHRWGQDSTMDLLTLIHSLSLTDRSQDMCPCAIQRSHLDPC